jgi:hypothetical protein
MKFEPVRAEPVEALRRLPLPFDKLRANGEDIIVPHQ